MKKFICTAVTFLMTAALLCSLAFSAASKDFTFTASLPAAVSEGDQFVVSVSLKSGVNIAGYKLKISFDSQSIEVLSQTASGNILEAECFGDFLKECPGMNQATKTDSGYLFTAVNLDGSKTYSGNGVIAVLKCKALKKMTATQLSNAISVTPSEPDSLKWSNALDRAAATYEVVIDIEKADLTALNDAVKQAEAVNKAEHSISSYAVLSTALTAARSFTGTVFADRQGEVDKATSDLTNAIAALKPTYTTALNDAVKQAEAVNSRLVTSDTYTKLETALDTARDELNKEFNSQTTDKAIIAATDALNAAVKGLKDSEYKKLQDMINSCKNFVKADYTSSTYSVFSGVLSDAQKTVASEKSSEKDCSSAADTLKKAISSLRFVLADKIEEAKKYDDKAKYSTKTLNALRDAISDAEKVLASDSAVKADRDKSISALKKAIDSLAASPAIALRSLVETAGKLNEDEYSEASYKKVSDAVATANKRLSNGASDEDLVKSQKAISDAIESLVEAPKVTLRKAVDEASQYAENDYSDATYSVLKTALDKANDILNDKSSTEKQQLNAVQSLREAIEALLPKPAKELRIFLDGISVDATKYTEESYAAFNTAVHDAEAVLKDAAATDEDADAALVNAQNAFDSLVSILPDVIAEAEAVDPAIYTTDSYAALTEALTAARELADKTSDAHSKELAVSSLQLVMSNLVYTPRELLRQAIESYAETDISVMSNLSAKHFSESLVYARAVLENPDATDEDAHGARNELNAAYYDLSLSVRPDLAEAIADAEACEKKDYTLKTFEDLTKSLINAKEVMADPEASEAEYAMATASLRNAMNNLKPASWLPDEARVYIWVIITMIVIIIGEFFLIGFLIKKRKNKKKDNQT